MGFAAAVSRDRGGLFLPAAAFARRRPTRAVIFAGVTDDTPVPRGRAIARHELEAVIRRAAELSLSAADDAAEELTEDEVVRIASELGLPSQHVRQALHERPTLQVTPGWQDRWFDPPVLALGRTVPGPADAVQGALEQYLTTYEYLQVVRRRGPDLALVPADDAISRIARVIARPGRRFGLAHAQRVVLAVQPLPELGTHVRIEADFRDERGRNVQSALLLGGTIGLMAGSGLMAIAITATGGPLEPVLAAGGLVAGIAGTTALMVKAEARRFRERLERVRRELLLLLDRAETGQPLDPPPAPWRRNLQAKLFGPRK
jgi:hypothetical protein